MARKREPGSKWPQYGLKDLTKEEAEFIGRYLKKKRVSFAYLKTFLLQKWVAQAKEGKNENELELT